MVSTEGPYRGHLELPPAELLPTGKARRIRQVVDAVLVTSLAGAVTLLVLGLSVRVAPTVTFDGTLVYWDNPDARPNTELGNRGQLGKPDRPELLVSLDQLAKAHLDSVRSRIMSLANELADLSDSTLEHIALARAEEIKTIEDKNGGKHGCTLRGADTTRSQLPAGNPGASELGRLDAGLRRIRDVARQLMSLEARIGSTYLTRAFGVSGPRTLQAAVGTTGPDLLSTAYQTWRQLGMPTKMPLVAVVHTESGHLPPPPTDGRATITFARVGSATGDSVASPGRVIHWKTRSQENLQALSGGSEPAHSRTTVIAFLVETGESLTLGSFDEDRRVRVTVAAERVRVAALLYRSLRGRFEAR